MAASASLCSLHLVYATDKGYLLPTLVSATSAIVKSSRPDNLIIHILDCGFETEDWDRFTGRLRNATGFRGELIRHTIDLAAFAGVKGWHGSLGAYARLLIPELLPDVVWCVYADGDTLFTGDIFELEALAPQGETALLGWYDEAHESWMRNHYAALGHSIPKGPYVGSGFLLMGLDWFREHEISAACVAYLRDHPDAPVVDETALNVCCDGHTARLPERWGVVSDYALGGTEVPGCIHYVECCLPFKLSYRPSCGYRTVDAAWFRCARDVLGLSCREALRISPFRWALGRFQCRLMTLLAPILLRLPYIGQRLPTLRFGGNKTTRAVASRYFWQ